MYDTKKNDSYPSLLIGFCLSVVLENEWEELFPILSKIHQGSELGFAEAGDDLCCVSVVGKTSVLYLQIYIAESQPQSLRYTV